MTNHQHDELTSEERATLHDPWLTANLELTGRSDAFKEAYKRKFGIEPPNRNDFVIALDERVNSDVSSGAQLKAAVTKLMRSEEGRHELSERDPKWRATYLDSIIEQIVLEFRRRCPDYLPTEWNVDMLTQFLSTKYLEKDWLEADDAARELFEADKWTPEHLTEAYEAQLKAGQLQVPKGKIKPLSDYQKLEVIAEAQMAGPAEGIVRYIELSLGELPNGNNAAAVTRFRANNPKVCNEGTLFVFRNLHGNGLSDQEWPAFVQMVTARSPLLTYQQLLDGYAEFRRSSKPTALFPSGPQAATRENLDELSDEEIAERLMQARRAAAKARGAA